MMAAASTSSSSWVGPLWWRSASARAADEATARAEAERKTRQSARIEALVRDPDHATRQALRLHRKPAGPRAVESAKYMGLHVLATAGSAGVALTATAPLARATILLQCEGLFAQGAASAASDPGPASASGGSQPTSGRGLPRAPMGPAHGLASPGPALGGGGLPPAGLGGSGRHRRAYSPAFSGHPAHCDSLVPRSGSGPYRSTLDALFGAARREGVAALWRGHGAALLRLVPEAALRFTIQARKGDVGEAKPACTACALVKDLIGKEPDSSDPPSSDVAPPPPGPVSGAVHRAGPP